MQLGLNTLFKFLLHRDGQSLALVTIVHTQGASYRKAGTMMLIDEEGNCSGLISGGCLEDDLKSHALDVVRENTGRTVNYDLSDTEDSALWGLGLGCGGAIELWLEPATPSNRYAGLNEVYRYWVQGNACTLKKTVRNANKTQYSLSAQLSTGDHCELLDRSGCTEIVIPISPANRLLICGAGPDARPLASLALSQQWHIGVADHREASLNRQHFPDGELIATRAGDFCVSKTGPWHAAIIMTHNVEHDLAWLRKLLPLDLPYLGLLGPAARRAGLLKRAGLPEDAKVFGPAGLDTGAVVPEEIALSIMAHIQAVTRGRLGGAISS